MKKIDEGKELGSSFESCSFLVDARKRGGAFWEEEALIRIKLNRFLLSIVKKQRSKNNKKGKKITKKENREKRRMYPSFRLSLISEYMSNLPFSPVPPPLFREDILPQRS